MRRRHSPPAHITADLFREFRAPRRGTKNPEVMTNPLWTWLVEEGLGAYQANLAFGGPPSEQAGPCWSWARYGRSETAMPDGRVIRIGGEHEDHYDADFYIYNDVVVSDPAGRIDILGYSEDFFPPTDFHTATLVGDRIVLIGNLSYPKFRKENAHVLFLDTNHYAVGRVDTSGPAPRWLYKHSASLAEGGRAIVVSGGMIDHPRWAFLAENIDDWRLDLDTQKWERLTDRAWPRFYFTRADAERNHLYWLRDLLWARGSKRPDRFADSRSEHLRDLGPTPRLDLVEALYSPALPHSKVAEIVSEFRIHRVKIDDVTVRYVERDYEVCLTVEGSLPDETVELLRAELLGKLQIIENARMDCTRLMPD